MTVHRSSAIVPNGGCDAWACSCVACHERRPASTTQNLSPKPMDTPCRTRSLRKEPEMSGGARASCGLVFAAIRLCLLLLLLLLLLLPLLVVVLLLPRAAAAAPLWRRRGREGRVSHIYPPPPMAYCTHSAGELH